MAKGLVRYYSSYGHVEAMAKAVAEGAASTGAEVDTKRVPETVPGEAARTSGYRLDGDGSRHPSATELAGARYQGESVARTPIRLFG